MKKVSSKILYTFFVILFLFFILGPILWSFIMSITPQNEILANSTNLLPKNPTLENYSKLLFDSSQQGFLFRTGIYNSLKAALLSILIGLPLAILCAYPLSRMKFKGSKILKNGLLFTIAIPVFATIIPLYRIYAKMQLLDNLFALVLVYVTSFLPIIVWLLMTFLETIPKEIEEAASIDGCNSFRILLSIIIPNSLPLIFAAILIIFITSWNQFQIPLILAPSIDTKPIAVVISEFVTKTTVDYGLMNAGGLLAIIPPVLIALFFRRFLVEGISGSTKG